MKARQHRARSLPRDARRATGAPPRTDPAASHRPVRKRLSLSKAYERAPEDTDHCRAERGGKDDVRDGVPAERSELSGLCQCGFDRRGLSPFRPSSVAFRAGRLVIETIHFHATRGESFAFETTLSGRGHARSIPLWRKRGYRVKLLFLRLPTPEMAISRVRQRVSEGRHGVPETVVRRRLRAGRRNFERVWRDLVDGWAIYDSSGIAPVLLAKAENP